MDNLILKQLLQEYKTKRNQAFLDFEQKKKEILSSNKRLVEIEEEINMISIGTLKAMVIATKEEKENYLSSLKEKSEKLISEKNDILTKLNIKDEYSSPNFECKICNDTGYTTLSNKSIMCNCLKQKLFNIAHNKSNIANLEKENFNFFKEELYSDVVDKEKYNSNISPRENIKFIKGIAEKFINNFDDSSEKNLLFIGETGLGKTFLSNCIANEILKKGKTVLYQTAPIMIDEVINEKFNKTSTPFLDNLLTVDLLIIDDLGTETLNTMKLTELFTIINTRLLNQNNKITKTLISTNLSLKQLFASYNERIGSRLVGYYNICKFYGDDIRFKRLK